MMADCHPPRSCLSRKELQVSRWLRSTVPRSTIWRRGELEATPLVSSGNFTIAREAGGQYRLSIPGQTPSSGTLLLTGGNSGGGGTGGRVADNVFTYQPDGNDWIILSQDPESNSAYSGEFDTPLLGNGQSNVNPEYYFQFAFVPHDGSVDGPR